MNQSLVPELKERTLNKTEQIDDADELSLQDIQNYYQGSEPIEPEDNKDAVDEDPVCECTYCNKKIKLIDLEAHEESCQQTLSQNRIQEMINNENNDE